MNFKENIRVIPNYPKSGVRFKDITTLLKDGHAFQAAIDAIVENLQWKEIDLVVAPEARGYTIAAPLAYALGAGFVPLRKHGKLPAKTVEASYQLEYGEDQLAIHEDAILPGQKILVADDLLATGGTVAAALELVEKLQGEVVGAAFLIELTYLGGREKCKGIDMFSLVQYE